MALFICQSCGTETPSWNGACAACGSTEVIKVNQQTDKMIDKVIRGRFKIVKKLGQGGMGAVYLAEQVGIGHKVALKFLKGEFSSDPELARRFRNEAKSYSLVAHPNAVAYHDFGQDEDGNIFIAMEYCEGTDLKKLLADSGRLGIGESIDLTMQVADVLANAHTKGIVHRDLKPENIMIRRGLRGLHAKVLDFGIARLINENTKLTMAGAIAGTPRYMPPEQVQGLEVDHRADIYALGIVLFECLTGRQPFDGATIAEIMRKQVMEPLPHLGEYGNELELPELDAVVQRACAKKRDERFQNMEEFAQGLSRAIPTQAGVSMSGLSHLPIITSSRPAVTPLPGSASGMAIPGVTVSAEDGAGATMVKGQSYPPPAASGYQQATPLPVALGETGIDSQFRHTEQVPHMGGPQQPTAAMPRPAQVQQPYKPAEHTAEMPQFKSSDSGVLNQSINMKGGATQVQAPPDATEPPPQLPKSKTPLIVGGVLAVGVLVAVGFVLGGNKQVDPPKDPVVVKVDPPKDPVVHVDPPKDPPKDPVKDPGTETALAATVVQAMKDERARGNLADAKTQFELANLDAAETSLKAVETGTAAYNDAQELLKVINTIREKVKIGNGLRASGQCAKALPFFHEALRLNSKVAGAVSGVAACQAGTVDTTIE